MVRRSASSSPTRSSAWALAKMPAAGSSFSAASASRASSRRARRPARSSTKEPTSGRYSYRVGRLRPPCSSRATGMSAPPSSSRPRSKNAPRQNPRSAVKRSASAELCPPRGRRSAVGSPVGHPERLRPRSARSCLAARAPVRRPRVVALRPGADPRAAPGARPAGAPVDALRRRRPAHQLRAPLEQLQSSASSSSRQPAHGETPHGEERLRLPLVTDARRRAAGRAARPRARVPGRRRGAVRACREVGRDRP